MEGGYDQNVFRTWIWPCCVGLGGCRSINVQRMEHNMPSALQRCGRKSRLSELLRKPTEFLQEVRMLDRGRTVRQCEALQSKKGMMSAQGMCKTAEFSKDSEAEAVAIAKAVTSAIGRWRQPCRSCR